MNRFLTVAAFFLSLQIFSQTTEERLKIASFSDKDANKALRTKLQADDALRKERVKNYLATNPTKEKVWTDGKGNKKEIIDILPSGEIIYASTENAGAAVTARANALYGGGSLGINIQGQNMIASVWDGGNVRDSHQQFQVGGVSKIENVDGFNYEAHATHVAGTICAIGVVDSDVRGIAFNSSVKSYDWDDDLTEILGAAETGTLVSNHSYGLGALSSQWFFGAYDNRASSLDGITYQNPYYLPVIAAGNSRNNTTAPASTQIAAKQGYDLIQGHANAKNVITVAATQQVTEYIDASSVQIANFSSWGPSDDGRIKPDIAMKGVNVKSTLASSDTALGFSSGTSMASPGITGVVLLLQQYYNQLYSFYMRSATVKGLILHTADETGGYDGPDYEYGWGLVNAANAAKAIRDKNLTSNRSVIEERSLSNNQTFTKTVSANGAVPLQVSISWTDPASLNYNTGATDPATVYLVNDLDVKVTSNATGQIYYPWRGRGMATPSAAPLRNGPNNVDNFERVDIENPSGQYTITVTHKGQLLNPQQYSLIITSGNLSTLGTSNVILDDMLTVYPNPAHNFIRIKNAVKGSKVSIIDGSGKIVLSQQLASSEIELGALPQGQYILVYVGKDGVQFSQKFLKY